MTRIWMLTPALLLAAGCAVEEAPEARADARAALAAELRGYEPAGDSAYCVQMRQLGGNRSVGNYAIIFEGNSRDRLWVNRPTAGCPSLDFGRALQVRTTSSRLCRGDIATVFDPVSGMTHGGCALGVFQPYRRVD